MTRSASHAVAAVSLSILLGLAGCSSNSGGQSKEKVKTTEDLKSVANQLNTSQKQLDSVVSSIDQMQAGKDLPGAFGKFNKAVADIEGTAKRFADRRNAMQANRDQYIKSWQKELETINDPEVRAALEQRKQLAQSNFDGIKQATGKIREVYDPFMKDLKDVQTALKLDLNPAGVAAISGPMNSAKQQALELKGLIGEVQKDITNIAGQMSPTGK